MASKVCSHHKVSSAYHLPSLLFFGFLCSSINGDSMNSPNTACPSFDCGNGVSIRYPFWHQTQQVEYCGYPGFNLSCNGKNPELHYSCQVFNIKHIDYSNKSLALAYPEFERQNCPKVSTDVVPLNTTPPSSFNHTTANKILHFFYNCTLYPPSLPHIACLANKAKRSYVFVEGTIPEFDWHRYCESAVSVLVNDKGIDRDLVQGFGQALLDGFKLTWHQPDGECQSCEASGGLCSYHGNGLHRNFFCFCSDGRHALDCLDKGIVLSLSEPDSIVIGAVAFGGFTIAATIVYLIKKKRLGSYKPV